MRLAIIGAAGGYGRTVADVARQDGRYDNILHLDDHPGQDVVGKLDDFATFVNDDTKFIPAFGNNAFGLVRCNKLKERQVGVWLH